MRYRISFGIVTLYSETTGGSMEVLAIKRKKKNC